MIGFLWLTIAFVLVFTGMVVGIFSGYHPDHIVYGCIRLWMIVFSPSVLAAIIGLYFIIKEGI